MQGYFTFLCPHVTGSVVHIVTNKRASWAAAGQMFQPLRLVFCATRQASHPIRTCHVYDDMSSPYKAAYMYTSSWLCGVIITLFMIL